MLKSKSYFLKILRDFLLTLMVPVVVMILLFWRSADFIREQILASNQNTLNQFFEVIDTTFYEMKQNGYSIMQQAEVVEYTSYAAKGNDDITYSVQGIIKALNVFVSRNHYDLLVYFPGNQRVISGKFGSVDADIYSEVNYGGKEFLNQLEYIMQSGKKGSFLCTIEEEGKEPLLCIAVKKTYVGNHAKDYVVLQVISPEYLNKIMRSAYQPNDGSLLIFNENKELLLSGDGKEIYHLEEYNRNGISYEAEIENSRYMMQVKDAESVNAYYAVAVNYDIYWEKLEQLWLICLGGSIACILIGIFVAWRSSKRTYSPFISIINHIEEKKQLRYDSQILSEVEFINMIYEKEYDERKKMERKGIKDKLDDFFMALLYGEVNSQYADGAFAEYAMKLCSDCFSVAVINCTKGEKLKGELLAFTVKNVFEELFNRNDMGYVVRIGDSQYVVLINTGASDSVEKIAEVLAEGKKFFSKYLEIDLMIAVGNIHEGMSEIPLCYQEAKTALRYKYLLGDENCILYCQVCNRKFNYITSLESKLSRMFMAYLQERNPNRNTEQFVRELLEIYGINEEASIETVECFKYEILSVINKAIASNRSELIDYRVYVEELMSQPTLKLFEAKFVEILSILRQEEQGSIGNADICDRAKEYISEHYMDTELSVNTLADRLKISSYYLSKLFKTRYGISIVDYISKTRIQQAKLDLKNTSWTLQKIAEKNGFLSSTVFINTFKKWEGITPGNYRKFN